MQVSFTRVDGARYRVTIEREHGAPLQPRNAPGYDELMPHDLAHFVVEEQLGIRLGVFGQLAAGGGGLFTPAPGDRGGRDRRSAKRFAAAGRDDMRRSEAAVGQCTAEWLRRTGRRGHGPVADEHTVRPAELERVVRRLDAVSRRWRALPPGGSLTLTWPRSATVDPGGSRVGRRA